MVYERKAPGAFDVASGANEVSLSGTEEPVFASSTALRSPLQKKSGKDRGSLSTKRTDTSADRDSGAPTAKSSDYSIFNKSKSSHFRPEHHRPTPPSTGTLQNAEAATFKHPFAPTVAHKSEQAKDQAAFRIPIPLQPAPRQLNTEGPVIYSSLDPTTGDFKPVDQFASHGKLSGSNFWADERLSRDTFAAPDLYRYVDPTEADAQVKALFEGAFGDDDEAPRTRSKKRDLLQKVAEIGENMKKLAVEQSDTVEGRTLSDSQTEEADVEDEEDEDDDIVEGLTVRLLPHQVDGVSWMIEKELGVKGKKGRPNGGILADDMGLGKTIQALALILSNPRPSTASGSESKSKISESVGKSNLVVAPLSLIKQWESEIKTKVDEDNQLRVLVHHGPKRNKRSDDLRKYDVVITTYQTLVSEHDSSSENVKFGCFGVHWYRLILDEAHSIKNRNAKSSKACYNLRAHYRWCLTGTPMQNNLEELQSLIAFLKIKPYNELSTWKEHIAQPLSNGRGELAIRRLQAILRVFMLRRTKKVLNASKPEDEGSDETSKKNKQSKAFKLPKRTVETVTCGFTPAERQFYDALEQKTDERLEQLTTGAKISYTSALVLLLRLRQACNHIELVRRAIDKDAKTTGQGSQGSQERQRKDEDVNSMTNLMGGLSVVTKQCEMCLADLSSRESSARMIRCTGCQGLLNQQHKVMKQEKKVDQTREALAKKKIRAQKTRRVVDDSDDEEEGEWIVPQDQRSVGSLGQAGGSDDENAEGGGEWIGSDDSVTGDEGSIVVLDSQKKKQDDVQSLSSTVKSSSAAEDADDDDDDNESDDASSSQVLASAKVKELIRVIQRESHDHKFIVFSQFTTMLDIVEPFLRAARLSFTRYNGSMRNDLREASLDKLRTRSSTRILLCSLKCGSLGLNLTAASRVVILEPFWNPFVEEQAIDRVHRLNQTRDVVVYRLTVASTVEERIFELQAKKRALAEAAIEGGEATKLSLKDLLNLFKHDDRHGDERHGHPRNHHQGSWGVEMGSKPTHASGSGDSNSRRSEDPVYGRRW